MLMGASVNGVARWHAGRNRSTDAASPIQSLFISGTSKSEPDSGRTLIPRTARVKKFQQNRRRIRVRRKRTYVDRKKTVTGLCKYIKASTKRSRGNTLLGWTGVHAATRKRRCR